MAQRSAAAEQGPPDTGDTRLMSRIRAGEASALDALMRRHWAPLVRYIGRMLGSKDAAEDIAQDVFIEVWRRRTRWKETGSPRAFLYRIARNRVLKQIRHAEVRARTADDVRRTLRASPTPVDDAIRADIRAAFERGLAALPVRRREAFLLLRFQGLSLREAAKVMKVSTQTVANHATRAAAELRAALRDYLG